MGIFVFALPGTVTLSKRCCTGGGGTSGKWDPKRRFLAAMFSASLPGGLGELLLWAQLFKGTWWVHGAN